MTADNNKQSQWKAWVVMGLAALLWLPMLCNYFSVLQERDSYKLWPLLAVVIVIVFSLRWRKAPVAQTYAPRWALWLSFIPGLIMLLFGLLYYVPYAATMGWLAFMATAALYLSSFRKVENLMGLWLLLLLFLRPPYQMTLRIMTWMENLSISTTSKMLDYGGTIHVVQGNTLGLPSQDFRIDHICSGWVSLVSMIACAAVVCVVRNRRLSHCLVVFLMSLLTTWVLNIVRIFLVINVKIRYGLDLIDGDYVGIYHFMSFMLGIGLVLCTDALVVFLYSRAKKDVVDSDMIRRAKSPLARLWTWVSHIELSRIFAYFVSLRPVQVGRVSFVVIVLMLGSLIAMEAVVTYHRQAVTKMEFMYDEEGLTKLDENSFVPDRDGWELTSYDTERRDIMNVWGAFSSTWRLKYNGLTVTFSLDYPFHEWHDVKRCYFKVGWQLVDEKILRSLPAFEWQASQTDMLIPNGDAGFILCSNCDHLGNPVVPKPAKHDLSMLVYRLQPSQMTPPFGDSYDQDRRTLYQTQCMVANPRPLDEATKQQIRLMYVDFREQIRGAIASQSQNK